MTVLQLLTQFNLSKALSVAHQHKDYKLALLISQAASGSLGNRLMLRQQLDDWDKMEVGIYDICIVHVCSKTSLSRHILIRAHQSL